MSLSKRSRPISWMESSNTLASVSNYGGSECSLADRGRRRFVKFSLVLFFKISIQLTPLKTKRMVAESDWID